MAAGPERLAEQAKVWGAFLKAFGRRYLDTVGRQRELGALVSAQLANTPPGTSRLWAHHAKLQMEPGVAFLAESLQAELICHDPKLPLCPERPEAYTFHLQSGRLAMDAACLKALLERYAFLGAKEQPLRDIQVHLPEGRMIVEARAKLGFVELQVAFDGPLRLDPSGHVLIAPLAVRAAGLPVEGLMRALRLAIANFVPPGANPAIRFEREAIRVNPLALMPKPPSRGRVVGAQVTGDHLVLTYDDASPLYPAPLVKPDAKAYLVMAGHDLELGKVTMRDVCVQMVPLDPEAPWVELALPHLRAQLAAGVSQLSHRDELLYQIPPIASLGLG